MDSIGAAGAAHVSCTRIRISGIITNIEGLGDLARNTAAYFTDKNAERRMLCYNGTEARLSN
jgi:aconitase B